MTLIWFIVWLIANNIGTHEPLLLDPVNAWSATLILAIAVDLGAAHARSGQRGSDQRGRVEDAAHGADMDPTR